MFTERYEITQLTRFVEKIDQGIRRGFFYTILGTSGNTSEFEYIADRSLEANSTCGHEDQAEIGVYIGLSIRNSVNNNWICEKIYMEIDGVVQRTVETQANVYRLKTKTVKVSGLQSVRQAKCILFKLLPIAAFFHNEQSRS